MRVDTRNESMRNASRRGLNAGIVCVVHGYRKVWLVRLQDTGVPVTIVRDFEQHGGSGEVRTLGLRVGGQTKGTGNGQHHDGQESEDSLRHNVGTKLERLTRQLNVTGTKSITESDMPFFLGVHSEGLPLR